MQVNEIRFGNALLKVYRPLLTEEEREKRENDISKSLLQFGKVMEREKKDENKKITQKFNEAV